jgi:hypothetical protein
MKPSIVHGRRDYRAASKPIVIADAKEITLDALAALSHVGIHIDRNVLHRMVVAVGDANNTGVNPAGVQPLTDPSIGNAIQFLQAWLPGFVRIATAARKIDTLIGVATVGAWEDEEVIQGVLENIGASRPYKDSASAPLASWNLNWERRTVVRFEQGFEVGTLEEARSSRMRVSTAAEKRGSSTLQLEIQRNRVGFYGFNNGANRTYGFLNDPAIPAYVTVANGATSGSPLWSTKTFQDIKNDLLSALVSLRTNSKDVIDPKSTPITLAVATSRVDYLTTTTDFGISVLDWLGKNYPNVRVESAPELDDANGGAAVFYMYADKVDDGASDDSATFVQAVPSRFFALGVEKRAKSYVEDFSNATAGVMCKRPYAVVRRTGI